MRSPMRALLGAPDRPPARAPVAAAPPRLVVLLPEAGGAFGALARELQATAPQIRIATAPSGARDANDYVYAPDHPEGALGANPLRNALLCLAQQRLDFALVSNGMAEPPALRIASLMNSAIFSPACLRSLRARGALPPGARGRILRLPPAPAGAWSIDCDHPRALDLGPIRAEGPELRVDGGRGELPPRRASRAPLFRAAPPERPVIFALSVFMAVGGAERNLIEILKPLARRYAFVVLTTERLRAETGSLHHEILPHCDALYELGELAPASEHLALLDVLAASYRPRLLFVSNGSPWLVRHAAALRERFRDVPIVDQQAYDEHEGWIAHYGDPGIRSFDRFVAINGPIRRAFVERHGIAPDRIDAIHHAIDAERFDPERAGALDRGAAARRFGLPAGEAVFGLVGRLTAQKRPLAFLELARRARDAGLPDHFALIGDGELAARCDAYVREHALDRVHRIPYCDDMSQLYPLLSGLVLTSRYEGLPLVLLEALAMGVPVLAPDVGDVRAVFEELGAGELCDAGDGEALFRAFREFRARQAEHAERARDAAPRVRERFGGAAVAARYERCWQRAWADRGLEGGPWH